MKIAVTGASGFIGRHLIRELLARVDVQELRILVRQPANVAEFPETVVRVQGSLSDPTALRELVRNADVVFHAAGAVTGHQEFFENQNIRGTQNLAHAIEEVAPGLKRMVFFSSLAAGGPSLERQLRTEDWRDEPVSAYGKSKLAAEHLLKDRFKTIPTAIVRPPLVYGPGDRAVLALVKTVAKNLMPVLQGKGPDRQKHYSVIHVDDLIDGVLQIGFSDLNRIPSGEVFYLSEDRTYSYQEVLETIARGLGRRPIVFKVPTALLQWLAPAVEAASKMFGFQTPLTRDKVNELMPDYWICSNAKAKRVVGFRPEYDLTSGMEDTLGWYQKHRWI